MEKSVTSSILLLLLFGPIFSPQLENSDPRHASDEDEYLVYAAAIERLFAGDKVTFDTQSPVKLLVIRNRTLDENHPLIKNENEHWGYRISQLSPVARDTAGAYKEQNREARQLGDLFKLRIRHVLVEDEELARTLKERRWKEFYEKYPDSGGFIGFSRVGFNRKMNQALVYFEHWCGGVCGSGIYVLLERGEEGWKVTKMHRAWIS